MKKKRKSKIELLEEDLDIITSLDELNEKQRIVRYRMLRIFANNNDFEYEKLNKEYDIDKTKKLLYDIIDTLKDKDFPLYLKIINELDFAFWRIKILIRDMFQKIKNKYIYRKRIKIQKKKIKIYNLFEEKELMLLNVLGFNLENRSYNGSEIQDICYQLLKYVFNQDEISSNQDFISIFDKFMKIANENKLYKW